MSRSDTRAVSPLLDLLFEDGGVGRCLVAPDGSVLRANPEWLRSTGLQLDGVLGANIVDLFPATRDLALALHARARAGHRVEVSRHAQWIAGRETWWEGRIDPVPMEGGTGLLITAREVSALAGRAPAEAEAGADGRPRESEARLIEAQRLAKVGDWQWDVTTGTVTWSRQTYAMFGRSPRRSPPTYEGLRRYYAPASWSVLDAAVRRALDTGEPYELELEHVREDGGGGWQLARGEAVRDAEGRVVGLRGTAQDISERKRVEAALRESEERSRRRATELETVLDAVPAAVWISRDPRGDRIDANRFGAELLRRRPGENVSLSSPGEDRPRHFTVRRAGRVLQAGELPIQGAARGEEIRDTEIELVFEDGEVRHLLGSAVPLRDGAGRPAGSVGAFVDVTARKLAEARSESLARFPEENPDPVLRLDAALRVLYANRAALAGMAEIGLALDRPAPEPLAGPARQALAERRRLKTEVPSGAVVFSAIVVPVGDEVNVYAQDITARKHAEDARRASEEHARAKAAEAQGVAEKLEATLAAMTQGVMVYGPDGKVVRMNSAAEAILRPDARFKQASGPAARVALVDLRTPGGAPFPVQDTPAWRALHGERSRDVEMKLHRPTGEVVWLSASGAPIRSEDGTLNGAVVTFSDITDQKATEDALRASEEELRALVTASSDVLYRMSPDWTEMRQLRSGRFVPDTDEPTTTWLERYIHPDDRPAVKAAVEEAIRTGNAFELEHRVRRVDGGLGWTFSRAIPIKDASGAITEWFGAATDVTDRKRAEEALRSAISELRDANRRKTEFLAVLSHELRNPLAPIRNGIFILERAAPGSEQASRAREVVRRQAEHLTRLVDDLLDVMRIEHGKVTLQRTRVDLREVVRTTAEDLRSVFGEAGVELHVEHVLGPVWIDADSTRIAQVLGNLLQNAVKFTPRGGVVAVALRTEGDRAELRVRDTGVGMDSTMISRLFVPFAQAEQTLARTGGGLGLGLALVKGMVELHGGAVEARSEGVGRGAEFLLRLPLADPGEATRRPPLPGPRGGARLILVVEDSVDAAETLADILQLHGHRVRIAHDGRSGIELARELRPDVILCDVGLPDIDGYEVARVIRRDESLRATRVFAVSGYAQPEDRRRAREAGFDAHIAKPLDPDELMKELGMER